MHIITISGPAGSGKSEVLRTLAALYGSPIRSGYQFLISPSEARPLTRTFIDEMPEADMPKLREKIKDYPHNCRIFVAIAA